MPKIYEYFGIIFYLYTNDHAPVHVHLKNGGNEIKITMIYENGKLVSFDVKNIKGNMSETKIAEAKRFLKKYHKKIVKKWNDVQIYNIKPEFEKIETLK